MLAEVIGRFHAGSGGAYGSPWVTAELCVTGTGVNHKRVARVMRTHGIAGPRLSRRVRTTVPDPAATLVPDLFERDFTAPEPGHKYMGDITYLRLTGGEFLYPATVLDCFSRKVVVWSISDHMRTGLVADALRMAAQVRGGLAGAVLHSDHGAQCGSRAFADLCSHLKASAEKAAFLAPGAAPPHAGPVRLRVRLRSSTGAFARQCLGGSPGKLPDGAVVAGGPTGSTLSGR